MHWLWWKQEIFKAVKEISDKVKNDIICLDNFDDSLINDHLYTRNLPDVDLLIRTSGEQRISNFLLWQIAYAELYFTDVYWPDFTVEDLEKAIVEYQNRKEDFEKQVNNYKSKIIKAFCVFILGTCFLLSQDNYRKGNTYYRYCYCCRT